jgi:hypothetical protein
MVTCSLGTLTPNGASRVRLTLKPARVGVLAIDARIGVATPDATARNDRVLARTTVRR